MQMLNHKLVKIALEHASGSDFEHFCQVFYAALVGMEFIPLGGVHDGGADALQDTRIFEKKGAKPGDFYQATSQQHHRSKIRHTIRRLREVEREPKSLLYFTSRTVSNIDQEEENLGTELDVIIKIRDRNWITGNINSSPQTIAAFRTYLQPCLAFLGEVGGATIISESEDVPARTMCVFLGQEVERRRGNTDLLEAVTDSLILWALDETDPEKDIFLKRDEISTKIEQTLPSAKHFIRGVLNHRLELLASKRNPTGREIQWHKKSDKFCLPYVTRQIVEAENTGDEFLKVQILDRFKNRAAEYLGATGSDFDPASVAELALMAIEFTFETEGLELAAFLSDKSDAQYHGSISDQVDKAITKKRMAEEDAVICKDATMVVLRQAFYSSSEEERVYFGKLSRTYALLFTIRNDPKIVEYFKRMSSNFVLYVGSDIIIRALSERYLAEQDQMTVNTLRILRDAGSTLILAEACLDEVSGHLKGTDLEFQNYFMEVEPYIDMEVARQSRKILIRSYFYAKLDSLSDKRPAGWRSFIEQICSYSDLHKPAGRDQIRRYLQEKFGLEFASREDMDKLVDKDEVQTLTEDLKIVKTQEVLAINDARQILAVYGKRRTMGEENRPNPYGYRTWWFTHEMRVRDCTKKLVETRGSQYIMRPEFILNFISLSPSTEETRRSYATIFPTILGVRMSNRMREDIFHDMMNKVRDVQRVDDARAKVMAEDFSNRLKGDNYKAYEAEFTSSSR